MIMKALRQKRPLNRVTLRANKSLIAFHPFQANLSSDTPYRYLYAP